MATEGTVLAGRYELGALLGRGGMAEVFLGTDRVLDRQVAVKVLGSWLDGSFEERFRREALAAAGLSHPNLVAVYDTGSEDGTHFIVMEHVPGRTLADVLAEGPLDPERAASIAAAVAGGLAVAHLAGIVHRDVKPGNVMVTPDGRAKLMDLGIARSVGREALTRASTVLGTAGYISPEQARGDIVDHRSDIYSLGCVLFEMLTGRPPFEADNPVAIAYRHVHEQPPTPSWVRGGIPPALDAAVLRAMQKEPDARFGSAEEMASAITDRTVVLAPIAPTTPLPAISRTDQLPPVPVRAGRPPRRAGRAPRRSRVPALVALAALALLAAAAFAVVGREHVRADRDRPRTTSPSPSPSLSPEPLPPSGPVDQALAAFVALGEQGVDEGRISARAADEIATYLEEAVKRFEEGHADEAVAKLGELESKIDELREQGEIEPSYENRLEHPLRALAVAMLEAPSPSDGGDGDEDDD